MKNRDKEKGVAIISVLVITAVLFILLSVALRGYISLHKFDKAFFDEVRDSAGKIILEP
jgi:hypothetical protein